MTLTRGTRFGAYEIVAPIGAGGMGEVYRARDTKLNRDVAVKILPAEFTHDADVVRRFEQEALAASSLNHPNILTIYEAGESHGQRFIATELVDGETLRDVLNRTGRMTMTEALAIVTQVAAALSAAHAAGIVHRDIKPDNVMLRPDGYVKLLDFGIAKLLPQRVSNGDAVTMTDPHALTKAGALVGTVPYMSPEQARGALVDARTDVWSLGCLLYEMLAGRRPFTGETTTDILVAIVDRDPPPVSQLAPGVPDECNWIVAKMLRKNPQERYQAAGELLGDLRRLQQPGMGSETRSPFRFLTMAASVAAIAMIGGAAWYLSPATVEAHSLAVLPLKSLNAGDDYLGLGIADAVITRTSQAGGLIVRPTSAVRRYASSDTDALAAARELGADAVLEGNVQRAGDQLRVSVNLLRARDGASIWADSFDLRMTDIFTIQDTVAQQVASHLRLKLDPVQQARLSRQPTKNSLAYEFYLKGMQAFDQRIASTPTQQANMIDLLSRSIELDPGFAQAHAALARVYAMSAVFRPADDPSLITRAREEIARAQALDPDLPETALARNQLLQSRFEGFQLAAALRVVRELNRNNPTIGHDELGYLYAHMGLADQAESALLKGLELDPTSAFAEGLLLDIQDWGTARYDRWKEIHDRYRPNAPISPWYYLGTGRLDDAERLLDKINPSDTSAGFSNSAAKAVLTALRGDARSAEAAIPVIIKRHAVKDPYYHHDAFATAAIYAINGKSAEAVRWLREAVATGFIPYPMFERTRLLDRIRTSPDFTQFMSETKATVDGYRREFAR